MSSLLHLISTILLSLCHQQQLSEKDVHPSVWIQTNCCLHPAFTRTLALVLGELTKFKCHCLVALRQPITLREKFSLPCTAWVSQGFDFWDLGYGAMAWGPCHHLRKNAMMTFGIFHSLATACSLSQQWRSDDMRSQSKPALHPEGHSHTSFGHRWPCLLCHNPFSLALPNSLCSSLSANTRFGGHTG